MSAVVTTINNTSYLDVLVCNDLVTTTSNPVQVEVVDLGIVKTSSCPWTVRGGKVTFCTQITNPSIDRDLIAAVFRDILNDRLTYVDGSFTVNGVPETPIISGQQMQFTLDIMSGQTVSICFTALVR